ncbi:hypothetical protein [Streptomyces sp. BH104]|uniref:hypothetical protein n=1 Tax=Streptomyces sp. BH104 TaxID=3410407 RepID=UPI003BB758D7
MNAHVKAATRARLLGNLVHGRAAQHPRRRALEAAARHLHDLSAALLDSADQPTGRLPEGAEGPYWAAHRELRSGDTGIPAQLLWYVSVPVYGERPELDDLDLIHPALCFREREIRARQMYVLELGHLNSSDDQVVLAALGSLLDVHREWDELKEDAADEIRRDRTRPTVYRTADGKRSAEHLRGRLAVFEGQTVIAELDVPDYVPAGEVWQLINDAPAAAPSVPAATDGPLRELAANRPSDKGLYVIADLDLIDRPDRAEEPDRIRELINRVPAAA